MAPPGRRRPGPLTVLLGLLFLFSSTASAASVVLGVDIGTEYIKAVLVKPGIPLDIVLTKDSKRKDISAVAFKPAKSGALDAGSFPERFYGSDAIALQARFPGDVYPNLKQLLGIPSDSDAVKVYSGRYPALDVNSVEGRNTVGFNSGALAKGENAFSVEELLAMELKNTKQNAKAMAGKGNTVEDVVFTIPPFYTVDERRALEVAAKLAGLNTIGMVSDGMAVGINYGMTRTFPNVKDGGKPEVHMVFDMGAGSASATILQFQDKQVKDIGRFNKTIQEIQVLGTGWDRTLGGDALNNLLVDDMISEFVSSPGAKSVSITAEKVKAHGRTAAKLWNQAEKTRQVLSANSQTVASFESLFEDVDFKYKITRSKFEELTAAYAARVEGPILDALKAAGLTIDDIDSLIVHGGASRTPFVQSQLESVVGKAKIRANVNSDEAAVFGAAFKAVGLSPSFRAKEIRDLDVQGYTHSIQYMFNLKDREQKIFTPSTKVGAAKDLPFQMMGEFEFTINQALPGAGGDVIKTPVLQFKSGNLTRAVTSMIDTDGCDRESFNNYVQVRLSPVTGTPEVTAAWVTCEAEVEESKGGIVDGIKGFFGGGKKDQEALKDDESASESATSASESSSSSASSSASASTDAEPSEAAKGGKKKKEIKSAITFEVTQLGYEKHPRKDFKKMQERLSAFDASDKARLVREEVLNTLEAFTYRARDYLEDESFIAASTADIRSTLEEKLSATSDWIYSAGPDATEKVLNEKLKELKELVDPVLKRKDEGLKRPDAIKDLQGSIDGLKSVVPMVKEAIESAAKASSSAAEAASQSSASPSPSSSADPLDELDDDDASKTSEEPSAPTEIVTIYTEEDLTFLEETIAKSEKWLAEKEAAQKKLKEHEDAAFTVKELQGQKKKLDDAVMEMMQKKYRALNEQQRKAKKAKSKTKKTTKKTKKADKDTKEDPPKEDTERQDPTDEELREALEKAGIKGDGIKIQNLRDKFPNEMKNKDGKPLVKLDIDQDATEEDILAAIDKATRQGQEAKEAAEKEKGHDEL